MTERLKVLIWNVSFAVVNAGSNPVFSRILNVLLTQKLVPSLKVRYQCVKTRCSCRGNQRDIGSSFLVFYNLVDGEAELRGHRATERGHRARAPSEGTERTYVRRTLPPL